MQALKIRKNFAEKEASIFSKLVHVLCATLLGWKCLVFENNEAVMGTTIEKTTKPKISANDNNNNNNNANQKNNSSNKDHASNSQQSNSSNLSSGNRFSFKQRPMGFIEGLDFCNSYNSERFTNSSWPFVRFSWRTKKDLNKEQLEACQELCKNASAVLHKETINSVLQKLDTFAHIGVITDGNVFKVVKISFNPVEKVNPSFVATILAEIKVPKRIENFNEIPPFILQLAATLENCAVMFDFKMNTSPDTNVDNESENYGDIPLDSENSENGDENHHLVNYYYGPNIFFSDNYPQTCSVNYLDCQVLYFSSQIAVYCARNLDGNSLCVKRSLHKEGINFASTSNCL